MIDRYLHSALFLAVGSAALIDVVSHISAAKSIVELLAVEGILIPTTLLIGFAVKKIFDHFGVQNETVKDITYWVFVPICSIALTYGVSAGVGLCASLNTIIIANLIVLKIIVGVSFVIAGIDNLMTNDPNQIHRFRSLIT